MPPKRKDRNRNVGLPVRAEDASILVDDVPAAVRQSFTTAALRRSNRRLAPLNSRHAKRRCDTQAGREDC
jgi:hypothetical protein